MNKMMARRRTKTLGVTLLAVTALLAACQPRDGSRTHVIHVYGDSLLSEARPFIKDRAPGAGGNAFGVRWVIHSFPGAAVCDFLPNMADELTRTKPDGVVFSFAGNNFTKCMTDRRASTSQAVVELYRQDLTKAMNTAAERGAVRIYFVEAPGVAAPASSAPLNKVLDQVAASHVHHRASVITNERLRTFGEVPRNPDGVHFCPVAGGAQPVREGLAGLAGDFVCPQDSVAAKLHAASIMLSHAGVIAANG